MAAGAPIGNDNAAKGKAWDQAIKRALARSGGTVDEGLIKVAMMVVNAALDPEATPTERIAAWTEIGNRLDGKPHQTLAAALSGDVLVTRKVFTDAA